jgi:hypothetical protein
MSGGRDHRSGGLLIEVLLYLGVSQYRPDHLTDYELGKRDHH